MTFIALIHNIFYYKLFFSQYLLNHNLTIILPIHLIIALYIFFSSFDRIQVHSQKSSFFSSLWFGYLIFSVFSLLHLFKLTNVRRKGKTRKKMNIVYKSNTIFISLFYFFNIYSHCDWIVNICLKTSLLTALLCCCERIEEGGMSEYDNNMKYWIQKYYS